MRKMKKDLEEKSRGQEAAFLAKEQSLTQKQAALQAAFSAMQVVTLQCGTYCGPFLMPLCRKWMQK